MSNVDFPYRVDGRGRTRLTDRDDHLRDLIEQVLFTSPGERVNRPTFGCGLLQLVFLPNGEPLELAVRATIQGALHQWLGELIAVEDVRVESEDSLLLVTIGYTVRATQEQRVEHYRSAA